MLRKVVYAGSQSASFVQGTKDLEVMSEAKVSRERVQRWAKRVGEERVREVQEQSKKYKSLPLPEQRQSPTGQVPQVACVMMDGGRIQERDRKAPPKEAPKEARKVAQREEQDGKGYWKESLVGCCLSMTGKEHAEDPCPTIPPTFVDPQRMGDLSREIKGFVGDREGAEEAPPVAASGDREGRPEVLVKSVVATRAGQGPFGERLIAEAHARGFNAAKRKAFVADGASSNWSVHRKHFSHYTPILDFTHAICYVYAAAMAGRSGRAGWCDYVVWAQWLWEGSLDPLIAAVRERSAELGPPAEGDKTSAAAIVARTLGYLQNQRPRMKYAEYRKLGLPTTSSHIESTIKQINRRVKGTEKFWDQGAEPLLQLAADNHSQTNAPDQFWRQRRRRLSTTRTYQTAA